MTSNPSTGLLLLSGGFDSPVAGQLVLRMKKELIGLHFTAKPMFGSESLPKAEILAKKIGLKNLYSMDIGQLLTTFSKNADHRHYYVFMKRVFLRLAEKFCREKKFGFIVTGENLGQVSSQTLSNLSAISPAANLPIVRPLLCLDKQEIIDLAKRFETHDISIGPEVCDAMGPSKPVTQTTAERIEAEENKIPLEQLLESAYLTMKKIY